MRAGEDRSTTSQLLGRKDCIHVLLAIREGGSLRSRQIGKSLGLSQIQADRALKFLAGGLWIVPHTTPTKGSRISVEYRLGKRGASFLVLQAMEEVLEEDREILTRLADR